MGIVALEGSGELFSVDAPTPRTTVGEAGSLLAVYYFCKRSLMGQKGTGPRSVMRSASLIPCLNTTKTQPHWL